MTLDKLISELAGIRERYPEMGGQPVEVEHDDGTLCLLQVVETATPGTGCATLIVKEAQ